jgi:hypothetical protein
MPGLREAGDVVDLDYLRVIVLMALAVRRVPNVVQAVVRGRHSRREHQVLLYAGLTVPG